MISQLPDGSTPGGPLKMSAAQRHAFLAKFKMEQGWLLLTRAEMIAMKQAMDGCQKENERLNKELARMIAEKIAKENETFPCPVPPEEKEEPGDSVEPPDVQPQQGGMDSP